jgi:hypothetical protein
MPDETADVAQLDELAHELGDAGRLARIVSAHREQPDPVFARNLRDELAGVLTGPSAEMAALPLSAPKLSPATRQSIPAAPGPMLLPMAPSGPFPAAEIAPAPDGQPAVRPAPTEAVDGPPVDGSAVSSGRADAPSVTPPSSAIAAATPALPEASQEGKPHPGPQPAPSLAPKSRTGAANHPFGLAPEWPPVSTRAIDDAAGSAPAASVPTAGALDLADVDEASIEAFYKWAAKARAAGRTAASAPEPAPAGQLNAPEPVRTTAPTPRPASGTIGKPRRAPSTRPRIRLHLAAPRIPRIVPHIPRIWAVGALVACLVLAAIVYASGILSAPALGAATAQQATSATLIRAGVRTGLTSYQALQVDDEIQVAAGGQVNLTIDDSHIRLAPGADVKLVKLDRAHIVLDQLAGEVYYRVSVPAGGDYTVDTGSVTWVARGTAFDLDRSPRADGSGDQVVGLALVDAVTIGGSAIGTPTPVDQGMSATVQLSSTGTEDGSPVTAAISAEALSQAWIQDNANLDEAMELPVGVLAQVVTPSPTIEATATPTPSPSASSTVTGSPSASATVSPSATPTQSPTPKPTPTRAPTPKPTPAGPVNLGGLDFAPSGTDAGVYTFTWAPYSGGWDGNTEYLLEYSTSHNPNYPADNFWPGGLATDAGTTSFVLNAAGLQDPRTTFTYRMRLQVVRTTGTGTVLAQTATITVSITAPAPPA